MQYIWAELFFPLAFPLQSRGEPYTCDVDKMVGSPFSRRLLAGPTAHVVQLIENRLRGLRMHHKAALVVIVLLGVLAEWFFVAYEPPPKLSRGEKAAFWFLMTCAACWLLFVTGP